MTSASTTPDTVDPANIGPDDLWVVWHKVRLMFQMYGEPPVKIQWLLAAPGEEGLMRLSEEYGDSFLTAMPLAMLQQLSLILPQSASPSVPKWVRTALGTEDDFVLVRNSQGGLRVVAQPKDIQPGETEILNGNRADFDKVLDEGNSILRDKNWNKVIGDVRPFVKRGEVGWLSYQRNPEAAAAMAEILEQARHRD